MRANDALRWVGLHPSRRERVARWIAWKLPSWLVRWCFIRVVAFATSGYYGNTVLPELTAMDALERWEKRH